MKLELNFQFLHSERIGYGHHGLETMRALNDIGIRAYDGLPGNGDLDAADKHSKICKNILFLTIPTHVGGWYEGQRPHLFTMWEANELPETMRDSLHNFETILTPSQHCVELYSRYHDNVHYVPLGVDAERWHLQERHYDIFFNFLIAGSGARKGTDLAHKAFMELFGGWEDRAGTKPIPRLIMKNPKGENYGGRNVEVVSGYLSPEDEVALYASAHCYLQPSRGEGWGMQPLQAMAQGCPTILTNAHGHAAFADYAIPISATPTPAKYMTMFGDSGDWWEPNYDELKQAMWNVYTHYSSHRSMASWRSHFVRERFTWEQSAQRIVDALGYDSLRESFDEPSPTWFTPKAKLFKVVTSRDWKADIGGVTHLFSKGADYWKPADVKRVMFEAGVLDQVCVTDGDGLTETQIERLGDYLERQNHCHACGHGLNESEAVHGNG